jgi:hypothetical protein
LSKLDGIWTAAGGTHWKETWEYEKSEDAKGTDIFADSDDELDDDQRKPSASQAEVFFVHAAANGKLVISGMTWDRGLGQFQPYSVTLEFRRLGDCELVFVQVPNEEGVRVLRFVYDDRVVKFFEPDPKVFEELISTKVIKGEITDLRYELLPDKPVQWDQWKPLVTDLRFILVDVNAREIAKLFRDRGVDHCFQREPIAIYNLITRPEDPPKGDSPSVPKS